MTPQEIIWKNRQVRVIGILSRSGKIHMNLRRYVGRVGTVLGEAKNNMLLIEFTSSRHRLHTRSIPAGCVILADSSAVL